MRARFFWQGVAGRRSALAVAVGLTGCVTDPLTAKPVPTAQWTAENVRGYGETVVGRPLELGYGWDLRVVAGVARFRECTSAAACTDVERERPASDLVSIEPVGRLPFDAGGAEVLRMRWTPGRRYVVPATPP